MTLHFAAYTGTNFCTSVQRHGNAAGVSPGALPHDYVPGTDIYFHVHWSNAAATQTPGTSSGVLVQLCQRPSTSCVPCIVYCHCDTGVQRNSLSPPHCRNSSRDRLVLKWMASSCCVCTVTRAAGGDTCTDAVFVHTVDIHYQSTNMATKQKAQLLPIMALTFVPSALMIESTTSITDLPAFHAALRDWEDSVEARSIQ